MPPTRAFEQVGIMFILFDNLDGKVGEVNTVDLLAVVAMFGEIGRVTSTWLRGACTIGNYLKQ